ncbi:MAG: hypothetical protein ACLPHE_07040 [Methanobacterium sp.]|jgi:predicted phosphodiesterase
MDALANALNHLIGSKYDDWLKIAVYHHPVTGKEMMENDFMDLLTVHGFKIYIHGHIHQAIEEFHKYDDEKGIFVIGAGTFGAPSESQVKGILLQYNLIIYDSKKGSIIVKTRKKEKINGAWSADARWGDKNKPKPQYTLQL